MKNLKNVIKEGLADWDEGDFEKSIKKETSKSAIKKYIIDWLEENCSYKIFKSKIKFDTSTTPWTLNYDDSIIFNNGITKLTNGLFQWGNVECEFRITHSNLESLEDCPKYVGGFDCSHSIHLKSLEGAPEVYGPFNCSHCKNLKSLEGCPNKVDRFNCSDCDNLTSLEGGPKEANDFKCSYCKNLKSLKGVPNIITNNFDCMHCENIRSLKYAPSKVNGSFWCGHCGTKFTKEDVKNISDVKGIIIC